MNPSDLIPEHFIKLAIERRACPDAIDWLRAKPRMIGDLLDHPDWIVWAMGCITGALEPLLAAGYNVEARDRRGQTPLHLAARYDHADCMTALLSAGADVDARDKWGQTPLHAAAWFGRTDCVKLLEIAGGTK